LTQLARTIRDTPNKGRMHVFLGHPNSDGGDKTTVEPGNTFSPGLWTCGVSLWIETADGRLWTPDTLPDDAVRWGFADGRDGPPVLDTRWGAGESVVVSSKLCQAGGAGSEGVDFCEASVAASEGAGRVEGVCTLVVRDAGPAGAKIESLEWDAEALALQVGGGARIVLEDAPDTVTIVPADAEFDSPLALLRFPFALVPGQKLWLSFKAEHGYAGRPGAAHIPREEPFGALSVEEGIAESCQDWIGRRPGRLIAPDSRLTRVWDRCAYHLQAAMENGLPRIGVANYPFFWMRDGVLALRALDVMGRPDLGRTACESLVSLIFSGGFGAEADAPGEGIWALVSHARITQDFDWLTPYFPQIKRRAEWLERMLDADAPIRLVGENRLPAYTDTPAVNLLCLPSENGLIRGRMDWHSPDFYINCWAVAGFRLAAQAAAGAGKAGPHFAWTDRADRLEEALARHLLPLYGNERDPVVTPHPTGALADHTDALRAQFEAWFRANRLGSDGTRSPEKRWTYFEVAQVHNAFRLGLDDLAWPALDELLGEGGTATWDVSAFGEGAPGGAEFLPYRNGEGRRGWLDPQTAQAGNMPHGWTAAEWILLIRDLFVRDDGPRLVLGAHIPQSWLLPGARFGVSGLPTRFGLVSYQATVGDRGEIEWEYDGPEEYEVGWEK